jgi:hypothetical protein
MPKNAEIYKCDICDFNCSKESNLKKHFLTQKHQKLTFLTENVKKMPDHICINCKKHYKSREGLWYHKKKCTIPINNNITTNNLNTILDVSQLTHLVLEVVKSNQDFQKQTQEMYQDIQSQMNNIYNTNNTKNTKNITNNIFNMNFFLNEKCKDAMNIMDFVNSMTLQFSDLEQVGNLGYVEGISKIIINKLNELDVYKRPIHCSDAKREIIYVRDNDVWEKENVTYDKLRKAIKYITKKNGDLLIPWSENHPSCMNIDNKLNDVYMSLMNQAMGGKEDFICSENKIIKKLSKAFLIDKHHIH